LCYQITATNSPTIFNATGLPSGISVSTTTGHISGTPAAAGVSTVALSATNAGGTGTASLVLTISSAPSNPPVITSSTTASGTVGAAFSYQITATNNPTSFNATGLPSGLSVNTSNGLISGTPTAAGMSTVTLSAANSVGTSTAALVVTISPAPPAPPSPASASAYALAFPNPAVKTNPTIRSFVGVADSVEITIFNAHGRVVHSATVAGSPTGALNGQFYYDYAWTGPKASGVYFAVIHGKAADGSVVHARVRFAVVE